MTTPEGRVLDTDSTVATLACHLPAGVTVPVGTGQWGAREVALFQAEHLVAAGYGLVELVPRERPVPWQDGGR